MADKKTQRIPVHVSEPLELELRRLADADGRKLSDFVGWVLRQYVYGHALKISDGLDDEQEDE